MKVLPVHARHPDRGFASLFRELARRDRFGRHQIVDDASAADIILFLDVNELADDLELFAVRRHPLVTRFPDRTFVYCENDQPWCAMPGLYVSMPKRFYQRGRQRACGYIAQTMNETLSVEAANRVSPDLLFSFVGRGGNRVREAVLAVRHFRGEVQDTSKACFFEPHSAALEKMKRDYAEIMYRSQFVLCPRGAGTSSYRLFETMQIGRVPVIISDEWVPPDGPAWDQFALFCRERDIASVPAMLERFAASAANMGRLAREAWAAWFAPDVLFHRMVEGCGAIPANRRIPETICGLSPSVRLWQLRARRFKAAMTQAL